MNKNNSSRITKIKQKFPLELQEYVLDLIPIPYDLFLKYKNDIKCGYQVEATCEKCNEKFLCKWDALKARHHDVCLCKHCAYGYANKIRYGVIEELRQYDTENPIPFDVYLQYQDQINNTKLAINIDCKICGKNYIIPSNNIKNRQYCPNQEFCHTCVKKYKNDCSLIEDDFIYFIKNNLLLTFETYLKYRTLINISFNFKIQFKCECCNKMSTMNWNKISVRQYGADKNICQNCYPKYVSGLEEVREINRQGQINLHKNNPEIAIKMSKILKEMHKNNPEIAIKIGETLKETHKNNPEIAIKIGEILKEKYKNNPEIAIQIGESIKEFYNTEAGQIERLNCSIRAKANWENPDFRERCTSNTNHLSGKYGHIYFDSSWELSYIVYYWGNIERSHLSINYEYEGEQKRYYPDFLVNINNIKTLTEIKGWEKDGVIEIKKEAALEYIKNTDIQDYQLLYLKDLKKLPRFIFYNTEARIQTLDQTLLIIKNYPKKWK